MPKRKRSKDVAEDLATIMRKVKKLERKISRRKSDVSNSESEDSLDQRTTVRSTVHRQESPQGNLEPDDWIPESSDHVTVDVNIDDSGVDPVDISYDKSATVPKGPETVNNTVTIIDNLTSSAEPEKLDEEVLEILGEDPASEIKFASDVRAELASRLQHIAREGLNKENRKNILAKYPMPANCLHIGAPQLNPEIKAALLEQALKRDKGIEAKQKQMACAISCLAEVITKQLNSKDNNNEALQKLMELARMLCDIQHGDSATRRNFILTALRKDMKDHLTNTKIDDFLFGDKLSDTIKSAKAVTKSGTELKADFSAKNATKKTNTSAPKPLNRKAPVPARRPPSAPQRSREPAAQRAPQSTYYKAPWQPQLPPPQPPPPPPPPPAHSAPPRRRF